MTEKIDFDELIVDIETRTYDLQVRIAAYVTRMLRINEGLTELDLCIPFIFDETCEMYRAVEISLEADSEVILVKVSGREDSIEWDDLDLSAQDMIVNFLHMKYTSEKIYRELSSHEDMH